MIQYDVFVSYSRKDKKSVMDFCEELSKAGISYWLDKDGISNGEQFKSVIVKAIEESAVFVFCSTVNSNASDWTAKEIGIAVARGKHIIPVKFDSSPYNKSVEFDLVNIDFVNCENKSEKEKAMPKLIATIQAKSLGVGKKACETTFPRHTKKQTWKKWYGVAVALVIMGVVGGLLYPHPEPKPIPNIDTDTILTLKPVVKDEFTLAKELMEIDSTAAVKNGFERMLALAAKGDKRAMTEAGITYFSYSVPNKEYRTENILQRRRHLGMIDNSKEELLKSMQYLSAVTDSAAMHPESYYLLGLAYFKQMEYMASLEAFKAGAELINRGFEVSHGYDAVVLKQSLENNIKRLNSIYGKQ